MFYIYWPKYIAYHKNSINSSCSREVLVRLFTSMHFYCFLYQNVMFCCARSHWNKNVWCLSRQLLVHVLHIQCLNHLTATDWLFHALCLIILFQFLLFHCSFVSVFNHTNKTHYQLLHFGDLNFIEYQRKYRNNIVNISMQATQQLLITIIFYLYP